MRYLLLLTCLSACTFMRKDDAEMQGITSQVLKAKEGIDIRVVPVDKEKGK